MSVQGERPVLVTRRVDGWLVGWLAVAVWVGIVLVHSLHWTLSVNWTSEIYWVGAVVTAAHFGWSYHLAYGAGTSIVRTRPLPMVGLPVAIAVALIVLCVVGLNSTAQQSGSIIGGSITVVYLLTTWHYIKQVYGVGRLAAGLSGIRLSKREADVLRYALYPLAVVGALKVLVHGATYRLSGYPVGFPVLPHWVMVTAQASVWVGAAGIAAVLVGIGRRARVPGLLIGPYLAAFLWLAVPSSVVMSILLLAPFHALQYLAIGHRAELALSGVSGEPMTPVRWLNIAAGAAAGGLLLSKWLPQLLDGATGGGTDRPMLFSALFFVFLNLHHYLIDATIWRSSGDLVRAIAGKPQPTAGPAAPVRIPVAAQTVRGSV